MNLTFASIASAPRDGEMLALLTSDGEIIPGWWEESETNFYASQEGWASYDPDNQRGDWVSNWQPRGFESDDRRLYCGLTPIAWARLPSSDERDRFDHPPP